MNSAKAISRSLATGLAVTALILFLVVPVHARKDIKDTEITTAVETEMIFSDEIASHLVDVATKDGIVTLSGSVGNILARDKAAEIAGNIKGVRGVVNRIEVRPVNRPDSDIEADVITALAADPATDAYEIIVSVDNGTVELKGEVDSYQERELCIEVAKGVKGVKDITDNIIIDYKQERSDTEIENEIERLLQSDVRIDAYLIDVSVNNGVVTLDGTVGSAQEETLARSLSWVTGVNSVESDDLEIEWWARDEMVRTEMAQSRSDQEIEKNVKDALFYDPRVASFDVIAEAEFGSVTLRGTVDSPIAKRAAEEDAKNTVGVWRVDNYIKIRPEPLVDDLDLIEDVSKALTRDPLVDRYDITVTSYNGKVFLDGTVRTWYEKERAEDVASRIKGVVEIQNDLTVTATWPWKSDWTIKRDIKDQLYWSPFVDESNVSVSVRDGVATLTGTVDSWREYRRAETNAYEGGARDVNNYLRIDDDSGLFDWLGL